MANQLFEASATLYTSFQEKIRRHVFNWKSQTEAYHTVPYMEVIVSWNFTMRERTRYSTPITKSCTPLSLMYMYVHYLAATDMYIHVHVHTHTDSNASQIHYYMYFMNKTFNYLNLWSSQGFLCH